MDNNSEYGTTKRITEELYYKRLASTIIYTTAVEYAKYLAKFPNNNHNDHIVSMYNKWFHDDWFHILTLGACESDYYIKLVHKLADKYRKHKKTVA